MTTKGCSTNIAILGTRGIPARHGGFETFAQELSERLHARGYTVTVFCQGKADCADSVHNGIGLKHIHVPALGPLTTIYFDLASLWKARRGYELVYMLGYGASLFCFIPRLWGSRVWINMDGMEWQRSKWNWIGKRYLKIMEWVAVRIADRIIADSRSIANILDCRHPRHAPISSIAYGAHLVANRSAAALDGMNLTPHEYYLVVCRIEPENHVKDLIEGFVATRSRKTLAIVGLGIASSRYWRDLQAMASERVRFLGAIYEPDTLSSLRIHCSAYLHGHSVGGTNPSLLEALGCGNIVVAHDNVFNREVAGDVALFFRTPGDVSDCIATIETMSPARRGELSAAARNIVGTKYSWEQITESYVHLMENTLE